MSKHAAPSDNDGGVKSYFIKAKHHHEVKQAYVY